MRDIKHLDVLIREYKEKEEQLNKIENKTLRELGRFFRKKQFRDRGKIDIADSIQTSIDELIEWDSAGEPILEFDKDNKASGQIMILGNIIIGACVYAIERDWNLGLAIELLKENYEKERGNEPENGEANK